MMNPLDKKILRQQCRRARQQLSPTMRQSAEWATCRQLNRLIKRGRKIAVYVPIGSEMRLDHFVKTAQRRGAQVYLPFIEKGSLRLWFTPYPPPNKRPTFASHLNVPQFEGRKIRAHRLSVMILPVVGVDKQGYRLGQGGGYYDATLVAQHHILMPRKVAVGFACQLLAQVPHEAHDCQVDDFVCETEWLSFQAAFHYFTKNEVA